MQRIRKFLHLAVIFSMMMTLVAVAFPAVASAAANLVITPPSADFGQVEIGATSDAIEFNILNQDNPAVDIANVTTGSAWFQVTANGCLNAHLQSGESCSFSVVFTPDFASDFNGVINIDVVTDPDTSVTVSGSGVNPVVSYTPAAPHDFGNVQIGSTSVQQVITVTNLSTNNEEILFVSPVTASNTDFTVVAPSGTDCVQNLTLAAGSSCSVSVTFTPQTGPPGPRSGQLTFQYAIDPVGGPGGLVTTSYAVQGTAVQAQVSAAPNPVAFGDQLMNTDSLPMGVTLTNTGPGPVTISTVNILGPQSTDFDLLIPASNCDLAVLAPGASCTVYVMFSPATAGLKNAVLRFNIDDVPPGVYPQAVFDVPMSGTGTTPTGLVDMQSLNFGSQQVGTVSTPRTVTITNTSAGGYTLPQLIVSPAGDYALLNDLCSNAFLAAGASCTFNVVFQPQAPGIKNAAIQISAPGNPTAVQLTGIGVLS
jgi:hypothetical protein